MKLVQLCDTERFISSNHNIIQKYLLKPNFLMRSVSYSTFILIPALTNYIFWYTGFFLSYYHTFLSLINWFWVKQWLCNHIKNSYMYFSIHSFFWDRKLLSTEYPGFILWRHKHVTVIQIWFFRRKFEFSKITSQKYSAQTRQSQFGFR